MMTTSTHTPEARSLDLSWRGSPTLTLATIAMAGLAYAMLQTLILLALPTIQRATHSSESGVAWLLTGYLLSSSIATPIVGRLGDMFGKRRILILALGGLAVEPGDLPNAFEGRLVVEGAVGATLAVVSDPVWQGLPTRLT